MEKNEKVVLNRNIHIGILFFIILIFGMLFALELHNSNPLGDIILIKLGLKPWSNDIGGFHYTIIYAFVMFIIGYVGVTHFLKAVYPSFIKRLPFILVIILILSPFIYSSVNGIIKSFSSGINAVDYNREISSCDFETDDSGNVTLNASLQFKNFSNKAVTFYIKYKPDQFFNENIIKEDIDILTAINPDTGEPQLFTLSAKSTINLQVNFMASLKTGVSSFKGSMSPLNITIFTEDHEKQFIKYH